LSQLADKVVLVTRPGHQADELIQLIEKKGARVVAFPVIEIQPVMLDPHLTDILNSLNEYDLLIFISANAVKHTLELLQQLGISTHAVSTKIAVIGKATRKAAEAAGFNVSIDPQKGFNSEALLKDAALQPTQIAGKSILILRGVGGLEELANTLTQRGANVSYAEVYRRSKPQTDKQVSRNQLSENWRQMQINLITVTSNQILENLYDMLDEPGKSAMLDTVLIVPSERCYQYAETLGFRKIMKSESATSQHMMNAICESKIGHR